MVAEAFGDGYVVSLRELAERVARSVGRVTPMAVRVGVQTWQNIHDGVYDDDDIGEAADSTWGYMYENDDAGEMQRGWFGIAPDLGEVRAVASALGADGLVDRSWEAYGGDGGPYDHVVRLIGEIDAALGHDTDEARHAVRLRQDAPERVRYPRGT